MSLTFPCVYCTEDLKCTKYTDNEATSFCVLGPCKDEKPSNGDKIRAMSDEELARFIVRKSQCPDGYTSVFVPHCIEENGCEECWLEWLKKEADNG